MKTNIIIWNCKECEESYISFAALRHTMDNCKCGVSGVDCEEYYSRFIGKVECLFEGKVNVDLISDLFNARLETKLMKSMIRDKIASLEDGRFNSKKIELLKSLLS